jgi:hypothetical protein
MQIESHNRLGHPDTRPVTRAVVYDDFRNPLAVLIQVDAKNVFMSFRGQPDFESALLNLGIRDTTLTTVVNAKDIPPLKVG